MAYKVEGLDLPEKIKNGKYPWDQWLDGSTWWIEQNTDYNVDVPSFKQAAYRAARVAGVKVRFQPAENGIYLQAVPKE